MEVYCCGQLMILNQYDPDQDEAYVGYDCSICGSSLYGTLRGPAVEDEEDDGF